MGEQQGGRKKILVLDDEPNVVTYLETLLRDNGYETVAAPDGKEAMEVLEREQPDLITLDLQMPHEVGTKFYRNIRKHEVYSKIPLIVISGLSAPHRAIPKATASLNKPFDVDELLSIVKEHIG